MELDFSKYPQKPHGGTLVNQVVAEDKKDSEIERARSLPSIMVDLEAVITIEMIATGVLSPNKGFMNEDDYLGVLEKGRLANGTVWPVPLSFAPFGKRNAEIVAKLSVGDEVALIDTHQEPVAILHLEDIFHYDKAHRAKFLFGTDDRSHPGVNSIFERMGDKSLGGTLTLLNRVNWGPFESLRQEPKDLWKQFYEEKKFQSVAGFITGANPFHRGHEYIHRNALETVDGLLLQPLVEMAKNEFVRPEYRVRAYRNVIEAYYPKDRAILSPLRVTYIFAGPREAVLHALIMKNYGCTHALIGRDHAGIGTFYDKYAGHSVFEQYSKEELGIEIQLFHEVFYCTRCSSHASERTCTHDSRFHIHISGTGIREMLRHGFIPPKEIVRPESSLAGIQGVQPKGKGKDGEGLVTVGSVIKKLFSYYLDYTHLGGKKREVALIPEDLTIDDLEFIITDIRRNASRIYDEIYREYSFLLDHNRNIQPSWVRDARTNLRKFQQNMIDDLTHKAQVADETVSDEFMYQDKEEAIRELEAAKRLMEDMAQPLTDERLKQRIWNPKDYEDYR